MQFCFALQIPVIIDSPKRVGEAMEQSSMVRGAIWAPILVAFFIQAAMLLPQLSHAAPEGPTSGIVLQASNKVAAVKKGLTDTPEQREADKFGKAVRESRPEGSGAKRENLSKVVLDGKKISEERLDALISKTRKFTSKVEYIDQRDILPAGCEIVALTVALRSMGYKLNPEDIADGYLKTGGGTESYAGSPYEDGGGLPPSIVYAANAWLADHSKQVKGKYRAYNLTKTPFKALADLTKLGYPVLVWVTEGMSEPWGGGGESWYGPEHCVVLYGVKGGKALVSDSLAGLVQRDKKDFSRIYKLCGKRAVVLLPK